MTNKHLIFTCACLWSWVSLFSQNPYSLVTTRGEAVVYAAPNEILLNFTITTNDEDIGEARAENRKKAAAAIAYLKDEAGIAAQHVQTEYMGLRPKDHYKTNKVPYYIASQTISVCITDLGQFEAIVDNLLRLKVSSVGTPQFRTTAIRKYKDEARQKAILAAREKAGMLSATLGQTVGKAHTITEVNNAWNVGQQSAYANSFGQDAPPAADAGQAFAPGQLEIRATVEVSFFLE